MNGQQHGTYISYNEDGTVYTEEYKNRGVVPRTKYGTEIKYDWDGSKKEETPYVNGKMHGTSIYYYKDGSKRWETPLVDDKVHGTSIRYNEDGSKGEVAL